MERALLVGFGGFLGSVGRYALSGGVHRWLARTDLPYGTLIVNLLGCGLIGVLGVLLDQRSLFSPDTRAFLLIGVLGGFTTFSTFAYETLALARGGESLNAAGNIVLHLAGCLTAVWLGDVIGRTFLSVAS